MKSSGNERIIRHRPRAKSSSSHSASGEDEVLEHYHNVNSVCAQKVRIALAEKGLDVKEHLLTLRGDQHDPAYRKLNPNGVVPTLVHDGRAIIESALILYYLDEAFPGRPLMPKEPLLRHRTRIYNKFIDEYVHNSCMILTFATAFRPNFLKMRREDWLAEINKTPLKRRAEYKRSVIEHGLESEFVADAVAQHKKLLLWMDQSLQSGAYLAGDGFSNADCAVAPYIMRLELLNLSGMCGIIVRLSAIGGCECARDRRSRPLSSTA
jgi:glutathione S-transferase